ncbi:Hypothetical predicted protein [Podarcis lilfordi]|uniref:Uncharacterized protein n=1 Tax=Podarcis lilfordi TaxID=74358 RepID=A0AA35KXG7_9SAUR|nr:Hypothetical predicted protein [Podarcis lilfordi]
MVPNGCKCSPEMFGGRNRKLFITEMEISPRQLNRQKKIFLKKYLSPGSQFHQKSDFRLFNQNGANGLQMLPGEFWRSKQKTFITGKEISPRQLNRQKRFFEKIPKPRVAISSKI